MIPAHTDEHELWLAEALTGARDALDARASDELARCPECQGILSTLGGLKRRVDGLVEEERDVLAVAARMADAPGTELVADTLRSAARSGRPAPGNSGSTPPESALERNEPAQRSRRFQSMVLLAAALVLGLLGGAYWLARPAPVETRFLLGGSGGFTSLSMNLDTRGRPSFRWQFSDEAPNGFAVHLQGLDSASEFRLVSAPRHASQWTPDDDEYARLRYPFEWYVVVLDASGESFSPSAVQLVSAPR